MPEGSVSIEGFEVTAVEINHKGGRTLGYRVASAAGSFAYLPDHAPSRGMAPAVRNLIEGVDVLLHDAQFTETERRLADDYGHATVEETVALAGEAGVGSAGALPPLPGAHRRPAGPHPRRRGVAGPDRRGQGGHALPVGVARDGAAQPALLT